MEKGGEKIMDKIKKTRIEDYNRMELASIYYNYTKLLNYTKEANRKWFRYWVNLIYDHFFTVLNLFERKGRQYTFLEMLHSTHMPQRIIKQAEFFIFNTKEWFTTEEAVDVINSFNNDDSLLDL